MFVFSVQIYYKRVYLQSLLNNNMLHSNKIPEISGHPRNKNAAIWWKFIIIQGINKYTGAQRAQPQCRGEALESRCVVGNSGCVAGYRDLATRYRHFAVCNYAERDGGEVGTAGGGCGGEGWVGARDDGGRGRDSRMERGDGAMERDDGRIWGRQPPGNEDEGHGRRLRRAGL